MHSHFDLSTQAPQGSNDLDAGTGLDIFNDESEWQELMGKIVSATLLRAIRDLVFVPRLKATSGKRRRAYLREARLARASSLSWIKGYEEGDEPLTFAFCAEWIGAEPGALSSAILADPQGVLSRMLDAGFGDDDSRPRRGRKRCLRTDEAPEEDQLAEAPADDALEAAAPEPCLEAGPPGQLAFAFFAAEPSASDRAIQ